MAFCLTDWGNILCFILKESLHFKYSKMLTSYYRLMVLVAATALPSSAMTDR